MNATIIEFSCPHCQRHFEAPPEYAGRLISCPDCEKPFTAPGLNRPRFPANAAANVVADAMRKPPPKPNGKTTEELFQEAADNDFKSNIFIVLALVGFVISVLIGWGNESAAGAAVGGALSGAALLLGFVMKIVAKLEYIRAELHSRE